MAVKVLVIATVVVLLHLAEADVSHLKLTSSDADVPVAKEKESEAEQKTSRLQSRNAILEPQQALETNAYNGRGYTYEKPSIPFETGNQNYDGYDYPKPANPMTYPPPSQSATTDQTFPDATARLRLKKSAESS